MTHDARTKCELFHVQSSKGNMGTPTILASEQNPAKQNLVNVVSPK